jgi:hypothetical protein
VSLQRDGALFSVKIINGNRSATLQALLDCGAHSTVIDRDLARRPHLLTDEAALLGGLSINAATYVPLF